MKEISGFVLLHFRNLQSEAVNGFNEHIETLLRIIDSTEIKIARTDLVEMIKSSKTPPELIEKIKYQNIERSY